MSDIEYSVITSDVIKSFVLGAASSLEIILLRKRELVALL